MRLDAAQFLTELHKLYERRKESGSIFVTMKRSERRRWAPPSPGPVALRRSSPPAAAAARRSNCWRKPAVQPPPDAPLTLPTARAANEKPRKSKADHSAAELRCLVRATDGKRRISTALAPRELPRFREEYATILRAHADALKKRERRAKKAAAE
jgi:hypothetical protein